MCAVKEIIDGIFMDSIDLITLGLSLSSIANAEREFGVSIHELYYPMGIRTVVFRSRQW